MEDSLNLFRVCVAGLWGYIDATGRMVIPPRFEKASFFSGGLAPAARKGWWGYIGTDGKWKIEPRYRYAFIFGYDGLGEVELENHDRAFIDRTGRIKIRFSNDERPDGFTEGLCRVRPPLPPMNSDFHKADGTPIDAWPHKVWFIDAHGKRAFREEFDDAWGFREGLSAVKIADKYGFIDRTGKFALPPQYDDAAFFSEGIACVRQNNRDRYITRDGYAALPHQWEEASFFSEGLAAVRRENKWGYINKQGKIVIPPIFETGSPFNEGRAACKSNGKYGIIDPAGNWIVPPRHAYVSWYVNGMVYYTDTPSDPEAAQGFMDRNGNIIWPALPYSPTANTTAHLPNG